MKVRANMEVDLNSRLMEAQKHVKTLEAQVEQLVEERGALAAALADKESALEVINDDHLRPLSDQDRVVCNSIATRITEAMRNESDEDSTHPTARQVINHELSGVRAPMTIEIVSQLVTKASDMVKATTRSSIEFRNAVHHRLLQKELSMSSMDSKESESFLAAPSPVHDSNGRPLTVGVLHSTSLASSLPQHDGSIVPVSREASVKTFNSGTVQSDRTGTGVFQAEPGHVYDAPLTAFPPATTSTSAMLKDGGGLVGASRKTKVLVEGATVISHGHYGNYKVKYCFVSKDLKTIFWKDMFEKKEPKSMHINECEK